MPTPWIVGSHRLTNAFEENLIEHVVLCLHAGGQQRVRVASPLLGPSPTFRTARRRPLLPRTDIAFRLITRSKATSLPSRKYSILWTAECLRPTRLESRK